LKEKKEQFIFGATKDAGEEVKGGGITI